MNHVHSTTTEPQKGKHLSYDERILIQVHLKDGWPLTKIAKEIGYALNTVRNEIRRGTVSLYHRNVQRHKARAGQATYEKHSLACGRHMDSLEKAPFLAYADAHVNEDNTGRLYTTRIRAHPAKKERMNVTTASFEDSFRRANESATLTQTIFPASEYGVAVYRIRS